MMTETGFRTALVTGGARSGKSRYAQACAEALPGRLVFVATAQAFDVEMADRIARHRDDRGERWSTVEEPFDLPGTIRRCASPDSVVLVDCLTLWASNLLLAERDGVAATRALVESIAAAAGPVLFVTNEVGMGIVPENALARAFRDLAGTVNQAVAGACDSVTLMVAGLPLRVK